MRSTSSTLSAIGILRRVSGYRRKLKWDSKYSVSLYTQLQVAFRVLQRTTTGDGFEKVGDSAGRSAKPRLRFRKRVRFTVEMHYDGLLTSDDYEFGAVAFCDRVDPDYFSLIELMTMAERVGVQDEYYQFLWAKPGQEIKDGLQTIEGEADILTCLGEDGLNRKHHLLKKQLCGVVPAIGDGFRLEEIGDDGTPIGEAEGGSGLSVIPNPLLLGCSAIPEGTVDQPAPDEPDHNPYHEASNEPPKVGEAAIEDMNPPVHSDQAIHGVDEIEGDEVGVNAGMSNQTNPATEVTEADQIAEGSTRWLEIDEILAEMHNEMQAEADQIPMNDDNNSFSSPSIYSSPSQHDFWDGRYNAYSSEDSDRPVHSRGFSREPTPISSDESDETFMPEGFENASLSTDSSDHSHDSGPHSGPHSGIERHDSNDDCGSGEELDNHSVHPEWVQEDATGGQADAGRMDSLWNEEELLEERGWGSEEDEEVQPDQYMIFNADRDLQHAEIVIGKDFKSFTAFKEFCKVNAIQNRRGVKFTVNDKIRCKCECMQKCGFWLYARIRGGSDTVKLISGQPEHTCSVEEDLRDANPSFLAKHYVARFRVDPAWSLRNFVHTGLQNVLEGQFPAAEHRYCARHLYVNYSGKFSRFRALRNLFWAACKATNKGDFDQAMRDFREKGDKYKTEEGLTPLEWMQRRQIPTWCKYYFDTMTSCENSLNNHCESFNPWILEARYMPILSCLETIRGWPVWTLKLCVPMHGYDFVRESNRQLIATLHSVEMASMRSGKCYGVGLLICGCLGVPVAYGNYLGYPASTH
ncbi:hypothetical protein LINPERPRIM_LOCUS12934 [Linum perenne]